VKVTILKSIMGWDADLHPDLTTRIRREFSDLGVEIIITEVTDNECTPAYGSVHNALVSEIDSDKPTAGEVEAMRQATWAAARRILKETLDFKGASPWGDIHAWLASVDRRMESTSKRPP
jgi:hypothetical protein